jgi:hypothetical protein
MVRETVEGEVYGLEPKAALPLGSRRERVVIGRSALPPASRPTDVLAMHGIVDTVDRHKFGYRNMIARDQFMRLLTERKQFVPLAEALRGRGTALTIDDGTAAAADAALLARECGHHVTLFVNPWECEEGRPYYFSYLSCLLDQTAEASISFRGQIYSLRSFAKKSECRRIAIQELRSQASVEDAYGLIAEIRSKLPVENIVLPQHLRPLTKNELSSLAAAGVSIESHHWSHVDPIAQSLQEFAEQFDRARCWIANSFGTGTYFAAPFGEFTPPERLRCASKTTFFLLDSRKPMGAVGPNLVNRGALAIPY